MRISRVIQFIWDPTRPDISVEVDDPDPYRPDRNYTFLLYFGPSVTVDGDAWDNALSLMSACKGKYVSVETCPDLQRYGAHTKAKFLTHDNPPTIPTH